MNNMPPASSSVGKDKTARLADFRDLHQGKAVLICGCGESLSLLERPERFITIGVNDVGRRFTPDYLVVVNPRSQFSEERFKHIAQSRARAIFTQLPDLSAAHPRVIGFRMGKYGGVDFSDPEVLHYTQNSPYVAMCLAIHMGARRIGLIGVDFTDHHFFARTGRHPLSSRIEQIDKEYGKLASKCRELGIEVFNLSPTSRLTAFAKRSLEEFAGDNSAPNSQGGSSRVFFVNYRFLSAGDVFTNGLSHAASALGVEASGAYWDDAQLPERIAAFAPSIVFVVHGRRFVQRWGNAIKGPRTAVWLTDEPYEVDDTASWSRTFDRVFLNDPTTLSRHNHAFYLPVAFDPSRHFTKGGERDYNVGFIGGYNSIRERALTILAQCGQLSYLVGGPWRAPALKRISLGIHIPPADVADLYRRTKIIINVFRETHHYNRSRIAPFSLNPRVYEALACGALIVSEPRSEMSELFPLLPTFRNLDDLPRVVETLLSNPAQRESLLNASRRTLEAHTYARRLERVLEVCSVDTLPAQRNRTSCSIPNQYDGRALPAGWLEVGRIEATNEELVIAAGATEEYGVATEAAFRNVKLGFEVLLDERCRFIAKVHQVSRGERRSNSYHLLLSPQGSYVARHDHTFGTLNVSRKTWERIELAWWDSRLSLSMNGHEVLCCMDSALYSGFCALGVTDGTVRVRNLWIESIPSMTPSLISKVSGWRSGRMGIHFDADGILRLTAFPNAIDEVGIVTERDYNDVELDFKVSLSNNATFVARLHQLDGDDWRSNSYHFVSAPSGSYIARHRKVFQRLSVNRCGWRHIRLRWQDQCLEVFIDGVSRGRVVDRLLQSGFCVLAVASGEVRLQDIQVREPNDQSSFRLLASATASANVTPLPFVATPRRNLMYHIWPVRGSMWRWNLEQLKKRIDLFNGKRLIAIVHDARSEEPAAVEAALEGEGCDFIVVPNGPLGEVITFPRMLEQLASQNRDEVTFYAHAKGVRHEPNVPATIKQWAQTSYRANLDDWLAIRRDLERFALTGAFRMIGRFRAHRYSGDWHYSGTFFWMRHAHVFARRDLEVPTFYGGVEAWPGIHFRKHEAGCLLLDDLRQLAYDELFWDAIGSRAVQRWESDRPTVQPPADLASPMAFEGHECPRLEQRFDEFEWWLNQLIQGNYRSLLTIGSTHGGVEWHVARRFHARGKHIAITAIDSLKNPKLIETLNDARFRFQQNLNSLDGDSAAAFVRDRPTGQFDAVFIDGNHSYCSGRRAFEFAKACRPRIVGLHDIVDSDWHAQVRCCLSRVWYELKECYATEERATGDWGGIGIVHIGSSNSV